MIDWINNLSGQFRDSGYAALTTFVMSLLALVVATASWVSSGRSNRRIIKIEEERDKERRTESKMARLIAQIVREPSQTSKTPHHYLEISNAGDSAASDIRVLLDGKPCSQHPTFVQGGNTIAVIGAKASARFMLAPALSIPLPNHVEITWNDDAGVDRKYETSLT